MVQQGRQRRFPFGAEFFPMSPDGPGSDFRVPASARAVTLRVHDPDGGPPRDVPLTRDSDATFRVFAPGVRPGARYGFFLDGEGPFPDPASRWLPLGPHGPSEVIASTPPPPLGAGLPEAPVLYELHIGTFTPAGTYAAAAAALPALRDLGVTTLELLPVSAFPGRFGWGYDGVAPMAPFPGYGGLDDLRAFVAAAHALGLAVILDVVYNHLGPDGNYLPRFLPKLFTERHHTAWGAALNFDGEGSAPVRQLLCQSAALWIAEYGLDGLRFDAVQDIKDDTPDEHMVLALCRAARAAAPDRHLYLVAENERQGGAHVIDNAPGGIDAQWNDDFHHAARVAVTGRADAYYSDYRGHAHELLALCRHGFLFQGQRSAWHRAPRGTPTLRLPPQRFVTYLQNHDQIANAARGLRLHQLADPAGLRAITTFWLLAPGTPLLFQGQEYGAPQPFLYFADHGPALAPLVRRGRRESLAQFRDLAGGPARAALADPESAATFRTCILDPPGTGARDANLPLWRLHRDLLRLRREHRLYTLRRDEIDGAALGDDLLLLRYRDDLLLLLNLGRDLRGATFAEPLLAPPPHTTWTALFVSEDPRYGGQGQAPVFAADGLHLPARTCTLLAATPLPGAAPSW